MVKTIWVVMEGDEPVYASSSFHRCHEHINEALDMGIEEAAQWVVRKFQMM